MDGVWAGIGVEDGEYPARNAPGTAPFFCGATPADADFTYEWIGTAYASPSARRGRTVAGVVGAEGLTLDGTEGAGTEDYNYTHQNTRSDGETTLGTSSGSPTATL